MSELPKGWELVSLSNIAETTSGIGFPKEYQGNSVGDLGFFKVGDISEAVLNHNGVLRQAEHFITFDIAKRLRGKPIPAGATVFAKIGEAIRLNRRAMIETPCLVDNNVMAVKALTDDLDRYVYYFLRTIDFSDLSRATTVPSLRKGDVEELTIPLPPLNEQKRIAAKLDALLQRMDACRAHLERVPLLLKRFRQAVLAAATSGQLTEDWRETQGGTFSEWQPYNFGDLILELRNGWGLKPTEEADGKAILRISSVRPFNVNFKDIRYLSPNAKADIYLLQSGDLLFTRYNGTLEFVGVCALVRELPAFPVVYPDKLIRVRIDEAQTLPGFIEIATNAPATRDVIENLAKTSAGQTGISGKDLKGLSLLLPPIAEQAEIVRRVETLFGYADRLEARYHEARAQVEQLTPALLAKAFRGELVPQDSNDEPASVLLARLQAERATAATQKPGHGKPSSQTKGPTSRAHGVTAPPPTLTAESMTAPMEADDSAARFADSPDDPDNPDNNDGEPHATSHGTSHEATNEATNGLRSAVLDITAYERETLLATIREVFQNGARYDADTAIRTIAHTLGYGRTGARIHEHLKNTLAVAVRRGILRNEAGEYRLDGRSIADYTHDECITMLLAALPRAWTDREEAIKAATRYLGFRRTGPALHAAFKSAINGAIRRGQLEYDRDTIRKR